MFVQKQISWFLFSLVLALICCFSIEAAFAAEENAPNNKENKDYFEMSLEELMNTEISGSGSLTKTTRRKVPATMTTITKEDIQRTGARSLDELLLITVPGLQKQFHRYEYEHIGIRGIMSDRDDKYLLLVNGRLMNERFFYGAMAERDLPMLKDIHHIDVVRGPGSSIYGPGAIGMVINITTDNALTFQGLEATARLGSIEEYYSGELKYGHRIADDEGVFLYGGLSKYPGASGDDAQRVYSDWYREGKKLYGSYGFGNRATIPKVKVHAQYNRGGLETWIRYTQGGHYRYTADTVWAPGPGQTTEYRPDADAYRKLTGYVGNRFEISPTLAVTPSFSFDIHEDYEEYRMRKANSWRRNDFNTKLMLDWTPNDNHQVTVGGEWSHAVNNKKGSWANVVPDGDLTDIGNSPFYTDLTSFMGEYQWRMSDAWTMFLGGRLDWHNYISDKMFSPRAALVWTPDEKNTVKLMYTKASRANTDSVMRQGYILHKADNSRSDQTDVETLEAYELRYERQHTDKLWLASSLFYHIHNPVAWGDTATGGRVMQLGEMKSIGVELEAIYRTDRMRIIFSHNYTKLHSYSQASDVTKQYYSAAGMGFGSMDFANYDNHSTKLRAEYDVTERLSVDGSMQVYWGCPGKRGWVKVQQQYWGGVTHSKAMYNGGAFLNLGAQYKANKNLLVRFDAYNIMGFFDKDINAVKVHTEGNEEYWTVAPAFGVSVTYTF